MTMILIGAYELWWFMSLMHCTLQDSVREFLILMGGSRLLRMG